MQKIIAAALCAGLLSCSSVTNQNEVSELPGAVQKAIAQHCEGELVQYEEEREHGLLLFELEYEKDGTVTQYLFKPDGELYSKIVGKGDVYTLATCPAPIRRAIAKHIVGEVSEIELEKRGKTSVYEVECTENGKDMQYTFSQSGRLINKEEETD